MEKSIDMRATTDPLETLTRRLLRRNDDYLRWLVDDELYAKAQEKSVIKIQQEWRRLKAEGKVFRRQHRRRPVCV